MSLKPPANATIYESEVQTLWLDENGILCGISKDAPRTLENQKRSYELIRQITDGKKVCYLTEVTKVQQPDKPTRDYVIKESSNLFKAVAVISESVLGRMIANILIRLKNDRSLPTRMFANETDAKDWLKRFISEENFEKKANSPGTKMQVF